MASLCSRFRVAGRSCAQAAMVTAKQARVSSRTCAQHQTSAFSTLSPLSVSILGAPMSFGQPNPGTGKAPAALRNAALQARIEELGHSVKDCGDVAMQVPQASDPVSSLGGKYAYAVGASNQRLAESVRREHAAGNFVLTLGGDHSIAMGSIAGLLMAESGIAGFSGQGAAGGAGASTGPGIIWVDAHADINVPATSPSGNIHGMPLAFLMKLMEVSKIPGCEWLAAVPRVVREQVVYIGLREVDAGEKAAIKQLGLTAYSMKEVDAFGIGKVVEMTMDHMDKRGFKSLHLSYDIDGVDPSLAPSTGTRVPGGLSYREAHYICEACADTGRLRSMDMVEINPDLAPGEGERATVQLGVELICSALGKSILS